MKDWTPEDIAALKTEEIKSFRKNASNRNAINIVEMCDLELSRRIPAKLPRLIRTGKSKRHRGPVIGYHLVCRPEEKGVTRNLDGTVWSGTWVVAESQAERSLGVGAYVALHLSHAEPSYLQGMMKGLRRAPREMQYAEGQEVKTPMGTDFLLQLTDTALEWSGEGTVEKSYLYAADGGDKD
jgi:hypothetical protein